MPLYRRFLRSRLAEPAPPDVAGCLAALFDARHALDRATAGGGTPSSALGPWLDYDVALIRLSQALGLDHSFFAELPPDTARVQAETDVARRLPVLFDAGFPAPGRAPGLPPAPCPTMVPAPDAPVSAPH